MNYYFDGDFSRQGIVDYRKIRRLTEEIISEYGVAPGPDTMARTYLEETSKTDLGTRLSRKPRL